MFFSNELFHKGCPPERSLHQLGRARVEDDAQRISFERPFGEDIDEAVAQPRHHGDRPFSRLEREPSHSSPRSSSAGLDGEKVQTSNGRAPSSVLPTGQDPKNPPRVAARPFGLLVRRRVAARCG